MVANLGVGRFAEGRCTDFGWRFANGFGKVFIVGRFGKGFGLGVRVAGPVWDVLSSSDILGIGRVDLKIPRTDRLMMSGDSNASSKVLSCRSCTPSVGVTIRWVDVSSTSPSDCPKSRVIYSRLGLSSPSEYDLSLVDNRLYGVLSEILKYSFICSSSLFLFVDDYNKEWLLRVFSCNDRVARS